MARYDRELRVRVNGDPALARLFVAEGRKYVDAVLEDMRLGGNAVGARRLVNAAGVMFRVLSMGSVPILEIDVTAVQPASDVVPAFMVWPGTTVDQHAFGETPQVLLAPLTNGEWRALFADVDSKPEGTSGRLYSQMFDAGFTRVGNVDWTRSDGRYSVSWYGPRSRYFVARRASTFLETLANPDAADESAYGDHQRHAEVFYKGSLLIDIETVSESLIDEADVYIRGAAIRETDDALYLIVVAAKYGGDDAQEFDSYEIDIHDYVLRFTLTPNSAVSSSLAVVADSGLLLEERIGLFEYESDHPWFFNDDVTEARAIRFLTDEDFDVNYVREVKLTVAANASEAEFEDIETAVIPTAVESESTDSTDGSSVFPSKIDQLHGDPAAFTAFVHPFVQDPVDSETGVDANGLPVPWFFEGIAEAVFYAVAPAVGSVTSTTTRSLAQAEFKIAVDWNGSEWVYAYSLGVDETRTEADSTNRQLTECYYSEVIDPAEPIGSSAGSVSRENAQTAAGRFGGLRFGDFEYLSDYSESCETSVAGSFSHSQTAGSTDYSAFYPNAGALSSAVSATSSFSRSDTRLTILHLDLRTNSIVFGESATEASGTSTMEYSYTGTARGHITPIDAGSGSDFTIPRDYAASSQTTLTYRFIVNGVERAAKVFVGDAVNSAGTDVLTPVTRALINIDITPLTYRPGTADTEIFPAELRTFIRTDTGDTVLPGFSVTAPSQYGDSGWKYLLRPHFRLYEHVLRDEYRDEFAMRLDNDGFAHYGSLVTLVGKPSFVYSCLLVQPDDAFAFHSEFSGGDLAEFTGRADTAGFAPAAYVPPTSIG